MEFPERKIQGFTLLELLVVLMILAIISSVLVLSFTDTGRTRTMQATVERVAMVLELARTEVTTRNEIWSFHIDNDHYLFKKVDPVTNDWLTIDIRPFQPTRIGEELEFVTHLDQEDTRFQSTTQGEQPLLVLYPSGEVSPFQLEIRLKHAEKRLYLTTDGFQKIGIVEELDRVAA